MEDVKDTLWIWAIQLNGLLGLGYATYSFFVNVRMVGQNVDEMPEVNMGVLIYGLFIWTLLNGPALGFLCFKLVALKKWAVCMACALWWCFFLATASASSAWLWPIFVLCVLSVLPTLLFTCALVFKPSLWRGGL